VDQHELRPSVEDPQTMSHRHIPRRTPGNDLHPVGYRAGRHHVVGAPGRGYYHDLPDPVHLTHGSQTVLDHGSPGYSHERFGNTGTEAFAATGGHQNQSDHRGVLAA
jgi:hypothetical protein